MVWFWVSLMFFGSGFGGVDGLWGYGVEVGFGYFGGLFDSFLYWFYGVVGGGDSVFYYGYGGFGIGGSVFGGVVYDGYEFFLCVSGLGFSGFVEFGVGVWSDVV